MDNISYTFMYYIFYLLHQNGIKNKQTNKTNNNACKTNLLSQPFGVHTCLITDTTNKRISKEILTL